MDKYEYNLKLEEIDKLVDQGAYEEAADVADAVDWRRVRNASHAWRTRWCFRAEPFSEFSDDRPEAYRDTAA